MMMVACGLVLVWFGWCYGEELTVVQAKAMTGKGNIYT